MKFILNTILGSQNKKELDKLKPIIDKINNFLIQPVRDKTNFDKTVSQLTAITHSWNEMLGIEKHYGDYRQLLDDDEIQTAINDNFKSELEIKNKENERLAQNNTNLKNISVANAEKEAAKKFAEAAEDRKKMVELEVSMIEAQAKLEIAKKWNGALPANIMPEGGGFILGMK